MLVDIFLRPTRLLYHALYRRLVPAVQPSYQETEWRDKESVQIPKFINGPQLRLSVTNHLETEEFPIQTLLKLGGNKAAY